MFNKLKVSTPASDKIYLIQLLIVCADTPLSYYLYCQQKNPICLYLSFKKSQNVLNVNFLLWSCKFQRVVINKITFFIRGCEYGKINIYVDIKWNIYQRCCLLSFFLVRTSKTGVRWIIVQDDKNSISFQPYSYKSYSFIKKKNIARNMYWSIFR